MTAFRRGSARIFWLALLCFLKTWPCDAQNPEAQPPARGKVIFSREHAPADSVTDPSALAPESARDTPDVLPKVPITNAERASVVLIANDLKVHLIPAEAREEVYAIVTLRNVSTSPLRRIPLQISGSLRWLGMTDLSGQRITPLTFTQSPIATDADHTGYAQEGVLVPAEPLSPGKSMTLSLLYSGTIPTSAARLELIGTPPASATEADWDAITSATETSGTALRGFGNVLWYPVAEPAAVFGDGNRLFQIIAQQRRRNVSTLMRLRLSVEDVGEGPGFAIFNGRVQQLAHASEEDESLVSRERGVATAEFPSAPIGFESPSLFLTAQRPASTEGQLLSILSPNAAAIEPYGAAAASVRPMLEEWLGTNPRAPFVLLDHAGAPYEEEAFLASPLTPTAQPKEIAPTLVRGLAHAWLHAPAASSAWINEGFAEFMGLLWTERTQGREAALAELQRGALLVALSEPNHAAEPAQVGQPLPMASADVFLRLKSAEVFWQLREILGEESFRRAMIAFRHGLTVNPTFDQDQMAFQRVLEQATQRDLAWFFNDWVYQDRGLPDLSIVQVNPRLLPARPGKNAGYLVAVEVRNDGDAVAEVPVTVRSGTLTSSERVRVPAHASTATRILFEELPETVQLNDGSVPEQGVSVHTGAVTVQR